MRNVLILVILIGIFYSCQHKDTVSPIPIWKEFVLEEPLAHLVDSFTCKNDNSDLYELYIDRVTSDSCVAILSGNSKQNDEKRLENIQPVAQIWSNKKKVNVYCGIENLISLIDSIPLDSLNNLKKEDEEYTGVSPWVIQFDKNGVKIDERTADPFAIVFYRYKVHFTPPVIKTDEQIKKEKQEWKRKKSY